MLIGVGGSGTPWRYLEALAAVQRKLDCYVLIHRHILEFVVQQYDGKYFLNSGSTSGSYSSLNSNVTLSFILMAI